MKYQVFVGGAILAAGRRLICAEGDRMQASDVAPDKGYNELKLALKIK